MTAHLALSHTPFHLLQLGLLAEELAMTGQGLVVFHEGALPADLPGLRREHVIPLAGYTGYRDGRNVAADNARMVFEHPAWSPGSMTLYCSDLKWLTNNLVYFALGARERARRTVLFTDGLGSYLHRDDFLRTRLASASKALLGLTGYGPRHRPVMGHHFGLDRRHAALVRGFHSRLIVGDIDKRDLPLPPPPPAGTPPPGPSLVIGVPLDAHRYTVDQATHIIDMMAGRAAALSHPGHARWYKPHHFEDASIAACYHELGFEILTDRRPAEILVRELGISRLFGTYSSVLAFGPLFSIHGCEAYSVAYEEFARGYLNAADSRQLRQLLLGFGVIFT